MTQTIGYELNACEAGGAGGDPSPPVRRLHSPELVEWLHQLVSSSFGRSFSAEPAI